ncbi:hypothetical protein [Desertivibrio insolitus]|uniref:hypothetical protein n=1 Tax=Herbiconiux sp. SYSU D00978 TaxID=2812562 RepID=UPI001A9787F3|nr:hypothetical protein [Herbiconiux sp. SYSU D00978]
MHHVTGDEAEYERLGADDAALSLFRAVYRGSGDPLKVLERRFRPDPEIERRRRMLRERAFSRDGDPSELAAFERRLQEEDEAVEAALRAVRTPDSGGDGAGRGDVRPQEAAGERAQGRERTQPGEERATASVLRGRLLLAGVAVVAFVLGAGVFWAGGRLAETTAGDPLANADPYANTLEQVREREQEDRDRLPTSVTARVVQQSSRIIVDAFYPSETMRSPWRVFIAEDELGYRLCFIAVYERVENSVLCVPEGSADNVRFAAYAENGDTLAVDIDAGRIFAATSLGD